jgi:hypothetical protein
MHSRMTQLRQHRLLRLQALQAAGIPAFGGRFPDRSAAGNLHAAFGEATGAELAADRPTARPPDRPTARPPELRAGWSASGPRAWRALPTCRTRPAASSFT